VAPLKPAADAVLLDTSDLTPEEAIAEAIRLADERLARADP
jgi:cytidylate kinase